MAVVLGYGGIANTNGARSFAGKAEAANVFVAQPSPRATIAGRTRIRSRWFPIAAPLAALLRII